MGENVYGLDLGTYEIKIYNKKKNHIWKVKDAVAMKANGKVFAVGNQAYDMYEKTPGNIQVVFPMRNGTIALFNNMQHLLQTLLKEEWHISRGATYVVAVPINITEVEKRAFYDLVFHSALKARSVKIVGRGIADAVGFGINIEEEKGIFIVNLGGDTIELSVIASGGIILNRLMKIGGAHFDHTIINLIRHTQNFLIGRLTAESLRRSFGVIWQEDGSELSIPGRNLLTGIPQQKNIPLSLVREAMKAPLEECVRSIKSMIERTPPSVRKEIQDKGIYLTGGLTNLKGLAVYLEEAVGLKVTCAKEPEFCAVRGLKEIILNKEYKKLTYSILDKDYRWLR